MPTLATLRMIDWMTGRGFAPKRDARVTLARVFDRSGRVPRPPLHLLVGELRALLADPVPASPPREIIGGDGHPVLALPAMLCGDRLTQPLRAYLATLGYAAYGWGLGRNLGPSPAMLEGVLKRIDELHARHGRKVSLVGISLGGVMAREAAKLEPVKVRRVVTLCSPFRLPISSPVARIFSPFIAPHADFIGSLLTGLANPPPVPTSAVYSRRDGIVSWQSCVDPAAPRDETLEIACAHFTVGRNARALAFVAERLAQPEEAGRSAQARPAPLAAAG